MKKPRHDERAHHEDAAEDPQRRTQVAEDHATRLERNLDAALGAVFFADYVRGALGPQRKTGLVEARDY